MKLQKLRVALATCTLSSTLLFLFTGTSGAQETFIALGQISSGGSVLGSETLPGGTVSAIRLSPGNYRVAVTAPGAFVGNTTNDFVIEATVASLVGDEATIRAEVFSHNDGEMILSFLIADTEDTADPDQAKLSDRYFYFTLRRNPGSETNSGSSPFLEAIARVESNGSLSNGFGLDGVEVSSTKNGGTGSYDVALSKPGDFTGDVATDYVLIASPYGVGGQDETIVAYPINLGSDDQAIFRVSLRDSQSNVESDSGNNIDKAFQLIIYRLNDSESTRNPHSRLLVLSGAFNASGSMVSYTDSVSQAVSNSFSSGTGRYRIFLTKPAEFAGKTSYDYAAHATVAGAPHFAMGAITSISVTPDTLQIQVSIDDFEEAGESSGVPTNSSFFLTVYSLDPGFQPDGMISKKASLRKFRGNNVHNGTGSGQTVRPREFRGGRTRAWLAMQNDGQALDHFRLRAIGGKHAVKARYLRLTGGKANVTAQIRSGAISAPDLAPGETARFMAKLKAGSSKARKQKIRYLAQSSYAPSKQDMVKLKVQLPSN